MEKPRYEKLMTLNRIEANNLKKKTISIIFIFNAVFLILLHYLVEIFRTKKDRNKKVQKQNKEFLIGRCIAVETCFGAWL